MELLPPPDGDERMMRVPSGSSEIANSANFHSLGRFALCSFLELRAIATDKTNNIYSSQAQSHSRGVGDYISKRSCSSRNPYLMKLIAKAVEDTKSK